MEALRKPNFFIVGAAKAGTTALHSILNSHPEVYMSPVKEPNYFSKDISINDFAPKVREKFQNQKIEKKLDGSIIPVHQAHIRSRETYLDLFKASKKNHKIIGEASVSYLYSKVAAEEIYKFNPGAKIVIIIRDPIERAFSHYLMDLKTGNNKTKNFSSAVKSDFKNSLGQWEKDHLYIELGLYHNQIKRYKDVFPAENLKIIKYESFKDNNKEVIDSVLRFLALADFDFDELDHQKNLAMIPKNVLFLNLINSSLLRNIGNFLLRKQLAKKIKKLLLTKNNIPKLTIEEKKELTPYFEEDLNDLENLLNLNLQKWIRN